MVVSFCHFHKNAIFGTQSAGRLQLKRDLQKDNGNINVTHYLMKENLAGHETLFKVRIWKRRPKILQHLITVYLAYYACVWLTLVSAQVTMLNV